MSIAAISLTIKMKDQGWGNTGCAGAFLVLCDSADNNLAHSHIINNHELTSYNLKLTKNQGNSETNKNICEEDLNHVGQERRLILVIYSPNYPGWSSTSHEAELVVECLSTKDTPSDVTLKLIR